MAKKILSFRQRLVAGATLLVAMAALAGNAYASVIYNGAEFDLTLDSQVGDTYTFTYTADLTNWDATIAPNQQYLAAVNFKPSSDIPTAYSLTSTNAPGTWDTTLINASASGCGSTTGSTQFICSYVSPPTALSTTGGGIYEWMYSVTYAPGSTVDLTGAPIRAWFVDSTGKNAGLMSLNLTTVPEPGAVALLGIGLLALGISSGARRRRKLT